MQRIITLIIALTFISTACASGIIRTINEYLAISKAVSSHEITRDINDPEFQLKANKLESRRIGLEQELSAILADSEFNEIVI